MIRSSNIIPDLVHPPTLSKLFFLSAFSAVNLLSIPLRHFGQRFQKHLPHIRGVFRARRAREIVLQVIDRGAMPVGLYQQQAQVAALRWVVRKELAESEGHPRGTEV